MPEDKLYLAKGSRYVESDPVRGESGGWNYSDRYLVVALNPNQAGNVFLSYLNSRGRSRSWELDQIKELTAEKDVPLEKRIAILGEALHVVR
ncbi:MAG: hypothetical protein WCV90_06510 [Candidatus Woesearchaeota archaeon]